MGMSYPKGWKEYKRAKKADPKSVMREGEMRYSSKDKKYKAAKKADPKSVVREGEIKSSKKGGTHGTGKFKPTK
jgi:hypothetical protein